MAQIYDRRGMWKPWKLWPLLGTGGPSLPTAAIEHGGHLTCKHGGLLIETGMRGMQLMLKECASLCSVRGEEPRRFAFSAIKA